MVSIASLHNAQGQDVHAYGSLDLRWIVQGGIYPIQMIMVQEQRSNLHVQASPGSFPKYSSFAHCAEVGGRRA